MSFIRKPYELTVQTKIKMLIYGQAGMGKTTLALSAPAPLLLDFDGGVNRVNMAHQSDTVQVSRWEDVEQVLQEDLSPYETLIIDTGGKMLDYMAGYLIAGNPKLGRAGGVMMTQQGYGERKGLFVNFCRKVMLMNKHLVFVSHRETRTEGENTRYVPLFGGSNYDALVTELDLVGYLEADGRKRVITFDGTDRNDGKNTCNLPSRMEIPVVVDSEGNGLPNLFLQKAVIGPYLENIRRRQERAAEYNRLIETLRQEIELITDEVSANDFITRIDQYEHVGSSKAAAGRMLSEWARGLGLKFNKEEKRYERAD